MTNRIEFSIADRRLFADGQAFGEAGPYERLSGRVHVAVDPLAAAQRDVVDLDKAARDSRGLVHCEADCMILKPVDLARGNRRLFYDYGNRGHKRALQFFNDAQHSNDPLAAAHAGNGFFMRRGYCVVWVAWEGDMLPGDGRMVLDVPVARNGDGSPITGTVRVEYMVDAPGRTSFPLSGRVAAHSFPTVSLDPFQAKLTKRRYPYDPPIDIPPGQWSFARVEAGSGGETGTPERAVIASATDIFLPAGFQPGWIYELLYTAQHPKVMGLGHVVVRDAISFLKYDPGDANPLRGVEKAYGWGRSQTGRCLRDFVYRGFNADAQGRRVFDGVLPHVAGAGRKWLNHRFASPIVSGGQQYEDHFNIADSFPFSYAWSRDHLTGREDAILKRPDTDPLVMHTQTSTEYWVRRGSLAHTDTQGNDLPQPDAVRVYLWASSQHFADPQPKLPARGIGQNFPNVVSTSMLFRALLDAMDRWATDGTPPPASRIPTRADGTLVDIAAWRGCFPAIPGVATPLAPNPLPLLDFGPDAERGMLREPPTLVPGGNTPGAPGKTYTVLVPAVDRDGNDIPGVRAPMVAAPLGTYTGWNLRARGFGHGMQLRFDGSYVPFAETPAEREATGDPRPSIIERYPDKATYVAAIVAAARELVAQGLMLDEDVERCAAAAANWGRPPHVATLE
ncbi:MAG TPA: alpha/beta hydrolase domain-containing protein [Acetobacteraceae bacterium]|nr:alpha/beta hydrolase domain-containing protein [Acetobacteraceae bacterium]